MLLLSQSLAHRAIIATAVGDHRAATDLLAGIVDSLEGDDFGYSAESRVRGGRVEGGRGRPAGRV